MREIERKLILLLITNSLTSSVGSGLVSEKYSQYQQKQ